MFLYIFMLSSEDSGHKCMNKRFWEESKTCKENIPAPPLPIDNVLHNPIPLHFASLFQTLQCIVIKLHFAGHLRHFLISVWVSPGTLICEIVPPFSMWNSVFSEDPLHGYWFLWRTFHILQRETALFRSPRPSTFLSASLPKLSLWVIDFHTQIFYLFY